jgi:hypothetical protein
MITKTNKKLTLSTILVEDRFIVLISRSYITKGQKEDM